MSIKEELIKTKDLILSIGNIDVNLFKVKFLFEKYFTKEEAEKNYDILIKSFNDKSGKYGSHDSLAMRDHVAGLLGVMIEEMEDKPSTSVVNKNETNQMKIFISHSSKNKNYGELLVEFLRNIGLKENEIIFTSNVAFGIPVGKNIFDWLKSQIEEKPFVIYLLSEQYYKSIACLNEMGAAWIIENKHAAIFTPEFDLSSKEFQNGVLDPREIGFYINDRDRILSFVELLSENFEISKKQVIISQCVNKFLEGVESIVKENKNVKHVDIENSKDSLSTIAQEISNDKIELPNTVNNIKGDLYSGFVSSILNNKLKIDEFLLLHYILTTAKIKLKTGWQEEEEKKKIIEWEKIHDIKNILSTSYANALRRFELRGFTEVSAVTSSDNPKEVKLKDEIASQILDFPIDVINKINEVVKNNYFEYVDEIENKDDKLPF
jgi:hypothetical protein